ncbi:inihibitor of recBCD nuclease [Salmonella phage JSS2]|uniref:Inihibitor of recBCD nuclease n=1 Tax=Salmonella phage JSS2 TaxID=2972749 RepID=A0AAE9SVD4_9CAUD|nr:inihibitor of recBCD nuclease [Salmonella phage JSS2]
MSLHTDNVQVTREAWNDLQAYIGSLEKKADKLDALEAGGVDNWSGYWFSLEEAGLTGEDDE